MAKTGPETFYPGTRVMVFDPSLFIDDEKTPLSFTVRPATVLRWYGRWSTFGAWADADLIDVDFDHRGESCGHFTLLIEKIK